MLRLWILCFLPLAGLKAQQPAGDVVAAFRRAVVAARERLAGDEGGTWGVRLDTLR